MGTLIEFSELNKVNVATQTGDNLFWLLVLLGIVLAVSIILYKLVSKKNFGINTSFNFSARVLNNKKILFTLLGSIVLLVSVCIVCFAGTSAHAINSQNASIDAPAKIKAYVDSDENTIKIDNSYIQNNNNTDIVIDQLSIDYCEGITSQACTWNVKVDSFDVYTGQVSKQAIKLTNPIKLGSNQKLPVVISTDLAVSNAKEFVGQDVLNFRFSNSSNTNTVDLTFATNLTDNNDVSIEPGNKLTVDLPAKFIVNNHNELIIKTRTSEYKEVAVNDDTSNLYCPKNWCTDDYDIINGVEFPIAKDTCFTLKYSMLNFDKANVTFNMNGHGSQIVSNQIDALSKISKPNDPVEDGYYFAGWYKDPEFNEQWDFDYDFVSQANVNLYARWQVSVTFTVNDSQLGHIDKKDGSVMCDAGTPYVISQDMIVIGSGQDMYWANAVAEKSCSFINWTDSSGQTSYPASLQSGTKFIANFMWNDFEQYLCFESTTNGYTNIKFQLTNTNSDEVTELTLSYSKDGNDWHKLEMQADYSYVLPALSGVGDKIYILGANDAGLSQSENYYWTIVSDKEYKASGDLMSLISEGAPYVASSHCFYRLFDTVDAFNEPSNLLTAPSINASSLNYYCFSELFANCNLITSAPELYSDYINEGSYKRMFANCTNLRAAPILPATEIENAGYYGMFENCTSLQAMLSNEGRAILDAQYIGEFSYYKMFMNCKSLKVAPLISAIDLQMDCFGYMFCGCESLTLPPDLWAGYMEEIDYWEVRTYGNLANFCYEHMFESCTSLTYFNSLGAHELAYGCYSYMFKDCKNLYYPISLSHWCGVEFHTYYDKPYACYHMFDGCSSLLGVWLSDSMDIPGSMFGINFFYLDSEEEEGEEVYKYKVNVNCMNVFAYMFKGCENLMYVYTCLDINKPGAFGDNHCFVLEDELFEDQAPLYPTLGWFEDINTSSSHFRMFVFDTYIPGVENYDKYFNASMIPAGWEVFSTKLYPYSPY